MRYNYVFEYTSNTSSFWGAFWGASLAFLFGLLTYIITKRRERFIQHKNALVKLNKVLNEHLNNLSALKSIITDNQIIIRQNKVPMHRLIELTIPDNLDMEIGSVDLINKFFNYKLSIDNLNFNTKSINHTLMRLEDLFINGQQLADENFRLVENILTDFINKLPKFNEDTTKLVLITRIHLNKLRNKNTFIYGVYNTQWEQDISTEDTKKEREKFLKEVEKNRIKVSPQAVLPNL